MTKVINPFKEAEYKPKRIELIKFIDGDSSAIDTTSLHASEYNYTKLLHDVRMDGYDVIACWNASDTHDFSLYLGHWNDGIV